MGVRNKAPLAEAVPFYRVLGAGPPPAARPARARPLTPPVELKLDRLRHVCAEAWLTERKRQVARMGVGTLYKNDAVDVQRMYARLERRARQPTVPAGFVPKQKDAGPRAPKERRPEAAQASYVDTLLFGRDLDNTGARPVTPERKLRLQLAQQSQVDEVLWGRDIDQSGPGQDPRQRPVEPVTLPAPPTPPRAPPKQHKQMMSQVDELIWKADLDRSGAEPEEHPPSREFDHLIGLVPYAELRAQAAEAQRTRDRTRAPTPRSSTPRSSTQRTPRASTPRTPRNAGTSRSGGTPAELLSRLVHG